MVSGLTWIGQLSQGEKALLLVVEPNLPDPEILFSCDCNPWVLYTRSPCLGVQGRSPRIFFLGCMLANSIMDPWYWVNPRIFPLYFPYKREHFKSTGYGIVLYWKRDCESVKRKCSSFVAGCIPSSFWTVIKGLANFFVDIAHRLGEPHYICVSL